MTENKEKEYKVWVYIEECDYEMDSYEDIGLPSSIGVFEKLEEAEEYVSNLQETGEYYGRGKE